MEIRNLAPFLRKVPTIFWGLVVLFIFFSFAAEGFISFYNVTNMMKNFSILLVATFGMTIAILAGMINMAVGSIMSLAGVVCGLLLHQGWNMYAAMAAALVVGALVGMLNGAFVGYMKVDFWIVTFASMGLAQGVALIITNGNVVPGFAEDFRYIADGRPFGVYTVIWIGLVISLFTLLMMYRTKFGSDIYAAGGSPQCAALSGIDVSKVYFGMFVVSSLYAAAAGILLVSRTNSASPIGGSGYEFDAIAATLIGGTPFDGGRGGVLGSVFGAFMIVMVKNALNLLGFTPHWQYTIIGFLIMGIIIFDVLYQKRLRGRRTV